jgi:hypothetical protein
LPENARKRADLNFAVRWDNAAIGTATHDDVAAALSHDRKAEPLKPAHDLGARKPRKLRHRRLRPRT